MQLFFCIFSWWIPIEENRPKNVKSMSDKYIDVGKHKRNRSQNQPKTKQEPRLFPFRGTNKIYAHLFKFHFMWLCFHLTTWFLLRFYIVLYSECVIFTSLLQCFRTRSIYRHHQMRLKVTNNDDDARFDTYRSRINNTFTAKECLFYCQ